MSTPRITPDVIPDMTEEEILTMYREGRVIAIESNTGGSMSHLGDGERQEGGVMGFTVYDLAEYADVDVNRAGKALGLIGRAAGEILGKGLRIDGPAPSMLHLADGLSDDDMLNVSYSSQGLVDLVRQFQGLAELLEDE